MVVLNAVYFKGSWTLPFNPMWTRPGSFYVTPDAEPVQVDMMFQFQQDFLYGNCVERERGGK